MMCDIVNARNVASARADIDDRDLVVSIDDDDTSVISVSSDWEMDDAAIIIDSEDDSEPDFQAKICGENPAPNEMQGAMV